MVNMPVPMRCSAKVCKPPTKGYPSDDAITTPDRMVKKNVNLNGRTCTKVGGYARYEGRCEHAELAEIAHELEV